ncbi:MAG: anti-sigma factor antagonist [Firmicutes bacterium]|nr:anti-sigma factor antagonist [Bacillota bacterium]
MEISKNDNTIKINGKIDSGNATEFEKFLLEAVVAFGGEALILDAEELKYISSAGLRILMKLRKQIGKPLIIENVSSDVYEIFNITGFTQLLDVRKKLREISIDGCEQIGAGMSSRVYRIDADTIVKVFYHGISLERIEEERENAKTVFVNGIPTAITFDIVKCGDCYGTVYELVDAVQFSKFLYNNPEKASEYRIKYAKMLKDMHQMKLTDKFQNIKTLYKKWISDLGSFFTQEESDALCGLVDAIPDRNTFVHCDAHIGNVMVQNGELILIDMADAGIGHPVFDIGTLCFHYRLIPNSSGRDFGLKTMLGFIPENNDMLDAVWNDLIKVYFEPKSEDDLVKINKIAFVIGNLRSTVTAAKHSQMPDQIKKTIVDATKKILLPEIEDHMKLISRVDDYFAD